MPRVSATRVRDVDWLTQGHRHSLGWVRARRDGELDGFADIAWGGGVHGFHPDTVVGRSHRRSGVGAGLVTEAARRPQRPNANGCTSTSTTT
ncbi:GNAT family N-acetyltransferase [Actinomadura citrea]|uniref:GNAT family N-acetyltransferase n=1 Tax=Actinomadura citrea TaxID=46158 RepID=UPI0039A4A121